MKIAIASGKGGTGKTTLSTNLAAFAAEELERTVVLADLDVEEPNSWLFLKGEELESFESFVKVPTWKEENCTHCGKCATLCNFSAIVKLPNNVLLFPELCHSCFACSELCPLDALPMVDKRVGTVAHRKTELFDFVDGTLDIGIEKSVPLIKEVKSFVKKIAPENSITLFDSPPGTSCPVIEAVKDVDFVVLVTEPTPFGLHDLKLAVDTIRTLGRSFGVVVNRFGIGNDDVLTYLEGERIPLLGTVKNDRKAAELYSRGELLFREIPEKREEFRTIFSNLLKEIGEASE